jgi:hypothetical protein
MWGRSMDSHDLRSIVIPLMVAFGLTVLGVLVAVYLGFVWDRGAGLKRHSSLCWA